MQIIDESVADATSFDWLKARRVHIFGQLVQLLIGGSFVTGDII